MPNCCAAYGCSNTTNVAGISTYYFPKDSRLKKKWVAQVKRTRDKWSGPTAHSVLCCNHFSQDCFDGGFGIKKKRKLKENAIPTIFKRHQYDDCDSSLHPQRKRKAYEKREQIRDRELVTAAVCHYSVDDDETVDMSPEPNPPEPETQVAATHEVNTIGAQVEANVRDVMVQTRFQKDLKTRSITCIDVGIQCDLLSHDQFPSVNLASEELDSVALSDSEVDNKSEDSFSNENINEETKSSRSKPESQVKYIIFEECLLSLFEFCHHCHFPCTNITKYICGTFICITQNCDICEAVNTWESQPLMKGIPAGNILLSASILFSGSLPEQALRMLNHFGCSTITPRTFFHHQDSYLLPAIFRVCVRTIFGTVSRTVSSSITTKNKCCVLT